MSWCSLGWHGFEAFLGLLLLAMPRSLAFGSGVASLGLSCRAEKLILVSLKHGDPLLVICFKLMVCILNEST